MNSRTSCLLKSECPSHSRSSLFKPGLNEFNVFLPCLGQVEHVFGGDYRFKPALATNCSLYVHKLNRLQFISPTVKSTRLQDQGSFTHIQKLEH